MEYVRILHLSATTMEANVDSALSLLLEAGQPFDYPEVRELPSPSRPKLRRSGARPSGGTTTRTSATRGSRPRSTTC